MPNLTYLTEIIRDGDTYRLRYEVPEQKTVTVAINGKTVSGNHSAIARLYSRVKTTTSVVVEETTAEEARSTLEAAQVAGIAGHPERYSDDQWVIRIGVTK